MPSFEDTFKDELGTDVFADKMISDFSFLDSVSAREPCHVCGKTFKFFCYKCHLPVAGIRDRIPSVKLPLKLEIIKHPKEVEGKSTAVHAAVIAPEDTTVRIWPDIPLYDKDKVLLVFPCDTSKTLAQLVEEMKDRQGGKGQSSPSSSPRVKLKRVAFPYDTVIFIESTWSQCHAIFIDERLQKLKRIQLQDYQTHFWRYQRGKPANFLSTIEAIYWFFVEFNSNFRDSHIDHVLPNYDNLLFFFAYMHSKIFKMYGGNLKVTEQKREELARQQKESYQVKGNSKEVKEMEQSREIEKRQTQTKQTVDDKVIPASDGQERKQTTKEKVELRIKTDT